MRKIRITKAENGVGAIVLKPDGTTEVKTPEVEPSEIIDTFSYDDNDLDLFFKGQSGSTVNTD